MAGIRVEINVRDLSAIEAQLQTLAGLGTNLKPALDEIGDYLVSETTQRFKDSRAPDGAQWDDVNRGGKPLVDRGHLRDSVHYQTRGDRVLVGSMLKYAAIHQLGGQAGRGRKTTITARPFLGLSPQDNIEIGDILVKHIQRVLA